MDASVHKLLEDCSKSLPFYYSILQGIHIGVACCCCFCHIWSLYFRFGGGWSHDSDVTRSLDQSTAKEISEKATFCTSRSLGLDIGAQNLNIEDMAANPGIVFNIPPYTVGICIVWLPCGNGNSPKEWNTNNSLSYCLKATFHIDVKSQTTATETLHTDSTVREKRLCVLSGKPDPISVVSGKPSSMDSTTSGEEELH